MSQTLAEHRMYLALAPVAVLFVWGLERWLDHRVELALVLALAAVLALATFSRNRDYRDNLAIWGDVVAKLPGHARERHFNLGVALGEAGKPEAGMRELAESNT